MMIRKILSSDIFKILFSVSLGAIATLVIQKINDRPRELEYRIDTYKNIFTKPEAVNKKLQLYLDSLPIKNLSILRLSIYNVSGKALEDLNLSYELDSKNNFGIDAVEENYYGQGKNTDFISSINKKATKPDKSRLKINCSIKVANRLDYTEPVFIAEYVFKNDEIPEINNLAFINPRIVTQLFDLDSHLERKESPNPSIAIPIALLLVFILFYISISLSKKDEYNRRLKLLGFLAVKLKTERREDFDRLGNPARTLSFIESAKQEYYDIKCPKWIKFVFNIGKPKPIKKIDVDEINSRYK